MWLLDIENPENNAWLAVNQFTVIENKKERRTDNVLFVNGLPLEEEYPSRERSGKSRPGEACQITFQTDRHHQKPPIPGNGPSGTGFFRGP